MTKSISLKINDQIDRELNLIVKKKRTDRSEIIRNAIHEYYLKISKQKKRSLFDKIEDLAGSAEGPEDLSTNKEYLTGYGSK